jgi:hypothetical protein
MEHKPDFQQVGNEYHWACGLAPVVKQIYWRKPA